MQKYWIISKKIFSHELISATSYMFVGSMTANIAGFIFNLILARNLSTVGYGIYGSLLAIITLVTILPQSFNTTLMKYSSEFFHNNDIGKTANLLKQSLKFFSGTGLMIFLILFIVSPFLNSYLHLPNESLLLVTGVIIFLYFLYTIPVNFLQGRLQFGLVSLITAGGGLGKLLCGFLFVSLGMGVYGALGGVGISVLVPFFIGMIPLVSLMKTKEKSVKLHMKEIAIYAFPASVVAICLVSFISIDLLLVKHFFSPFDAGLYTGLGFIGKAIFYFTGSIPVVMFPLLIKRNRKKENIHGLFFYSILLVLVPSLFVTGLYALFPHLFLTLFLGGKKYLSLSSYLGLYSLFITSYSVLNIIANFFISIQKTKISFLLFFFAILQICLISLFHASFSEIINISLILTLSLIAILLIYYVMLYGKKNTFITYYSRLQSRENN